MTRKAIKIAAIAATFATAVMPAAAMAHDHDSYGWSRGDDRGYDDGGRDSDRYGDHPDYRGSYDRDGYAGYNGYDGGRDYYRNGYGRGGYYADTGYQQGYYGRPQYGYRCHRDGSTGAIIGALAGGLLGNGIAGHGDRTLGTVLGGAGGALAGRAIERSSNRC